MHSDLSQMHLRQCRGKNQKKNTRKLMARIATPTPDCNSFSAFSRETGVVRQGAVSVLRGRGARTERGVHAASALDNPCRSREFPKCGKLRTAKRPEGRAPTSISAGAPNTDEAQRTRRDKNVVEIRCREKDRDRQRVK